LLLLLLLVQKEEEEEGEGEPSGAVHEEEEKRWSPRSWDVVCSGGSGKGTGQEGRLSRGETSLIVVGTTDDDEEEEEEEEEEGRVPWKLLVWGKPPGNGSWEGR